MLKRQLYSIFVLGFILIVLISCNPLKHVPEDQFLLNHSKIRFEGKKPKIDQDELEAVIKQKPNTRLLFGLWRPSLWWYNAFYSEHKQRKVGKPPVIYDQFYFEKSTEQLKLFLQQKGYYNCEVKGIEDTVGFRKRKINVEYGIRANHPKWIHQVSYSVLNNNLAPYVLTDTSGSLLKRNKMFSVDLLQDERMRIVKKLKNEGFYFFSKESVRFSADTSENRDSVNLIVDISVEINSKDSLDQREDFRYGIGDIYVRYNNEMDYLDSIGVNFDTLVVEDYRFIHKDKPKIRPRALSHFIFIHPNEYYNEDRQLYTYQRLQSVRKLGGVQLTYLKSPSFQQKLDCYINLSPVKSNNFLINAEGTNSDLNLGIAGNISLTNNNIFRGGEILSFGVKGGVEAQNSLVSNQLTDNPQIFNTIEMAPEISLDVPRFLIPFIADKVSKNARPRTQIRTIYNFQRRPEYQRNKLNLAFSYSWNETRFKRHIISPFNISYIKLDKSALFDSILLSPSISSLVFNSYQDNFITSTTYSFMYNGQTLNKLKDFFYLKYHLDLSGNVLRTLSKLVDAPQNENGSYTLFNIRFAQYIKNELELKYYLNYDKTNLVLRAYGGMGVAYGNQTTLPFEKSYYAGGANSLRAWQARSLGPGSMVEDDVQIIDQIGDIKIEGNMEFRFDVNKLLEGAFFVDAGNIWILKEDEHRPDAEFRLNKFTKDLAVGIGSGIRLDFSFFIVRFDLAFPIKDPSQNQTSTFEFNTKRGNLNVGIGYPF